jgi:hypothetical protein
MGTQENYRKTLEYAEALAGSPALLARRLEVESRLLTSWFSGAAPIPEEVFLKLVDIVLAASKTDVERSRDYKHQWHSPDD